MDQKRHHDQLHPRWKESTRNATTTSSTVDTLRDVAIRQLEIDLAPMSEALVVHGVRELLTEKSHTMVEMDLFATPPSVLGLLSSALAEEALVDLGPFQPFTLDSSCRVTPRLHACNKAYRIEQLQYHWEGPLQCPLSSSP